MNENYYILLELDPSERDWAVIDAAISRHQRQWSLKKSQGSPADQRKAARYLTMISDMRETLEDEGDRDKEARGAREQLRAEREAQLSKLDELIKLIGETEVLEEDVEVFRRGAGKRITEDDVRRRLSEQNIQVKRAPGAPQREPRTPPGADQLLRIQENLKTLKLRDLYEFLALETPGLNRRSSPKALRKAVHQVSREKATGRADARARATLAELAKEVFRSQPKKAGYDKALDLEAMKGLKSALELVGSDQYLDQAEMNGLVEMARRQGVTLDIALDYIEAHATREHWRMQRRTEIPSAKLKLCGYCGELARTPTDKYCHHCGEPLVKKCPHCGEMVPTQEKFCGVCRCSTGDRPIVERLIAEAKQLRFEGDIRGESRCLDDVRYYWPEWKGSAQATAKD